MAIGLPEFLQISIVDPVRRCMRRGALQVPTDLCGSYIVVNVLLMHTKIILRV